MAGRERAGETAPSLSGQRFTPSRYLYGVPKRKSDESAFARETLQIPRNPRDLQRRKREPDLRAVHGQWSHAQERRVIGPRRGEGEGCPRRGACRGIST